MVINLFFVVKNFTSLTTIGLNGKTYWRLMQYIIYRFVRSAFALFHKNEKSETY